MFSWIENELLAYARASYHLPQHRKEENSSNDLDLLFFPRFAVRLSRR